MNVWERINSFKWIITISMLIILIAGLGVLSYAHYKLGSIYSDYMYFMILRRAVIAIAVVTVILHFVRFPMNFQSQIAPYILILGLGCLPYIDIVDNVAAGIHKKDITVTQLYPVHRGSELKYEFSADGDSERFEIEPAIYNKLTVGGQYTAHYLGSMKTILEMEQVTNPDDFQGDYHIWLLDRNRETQCIRVIVLGNVEQNVLADIKLGMELFKRFVSEQWIGEPRLPFKLVVTADKHLYSQVLEREFRLERDDAERTAKNTNWYYKGDTVVVDAEAWGTRKQRIHAVAQLMSERYLNQVVIHNSNQMQWAYMGAADVAAAYIAGMAESEGDFVYKKLWSEKLRKAGQWPEVSILSKPNGWDAAYSRYGGATTHQTAALAVLYLVELKGFGVFEKWYRDANNSDDVEAYFEARFNRSFRKFSDEYNDYVKGTFVKK